MTPAAQEHPTFGIDLRFDEAIGGVAWSALRTRLTRVWVRFYQLAEEVVWPAFQHCAPPVVSLDRLKGGMASVAALQAPSNTNNKNLKTCSISGSTQSRGHRH